MLSLIKELSELANGLGCPFDDDSVLSFKNMMRLDDLDEFPREAVEHLKRSGIFDYTVWHEFDGKMTDFPQIMYIIRLLSQRNPTVALQFVLHFIGYISVLLKGTDEQKRYYSAASLKGKGISWGISEKAVGSDIVANQTSFRVDDDGYYLTGEKWPIGHCYQNDLVIVLAKDENKSGPAAHTMFIVDKKSVPQKQFQVLPRTRLLGLRGMDLSGVRLDNARADHVIGAQGRGLEAMLCSQHVCRIGVAAFANALVDTSLRIALTFATKRELFGKPVCEQPITRRTLVDAFADLLNGDIALMVSARSVHVTPKSVSFLSSVAKYHVPHTYESTMNSLRDVLGARSYLRDDCYFGIFQKLYRDISCTGFVDGNKQVNLNNITAQLSAILGQCGVSTVEEECVKALYDFNAEMPDVRLNEITVLSGKHECTLLNLASHVERLPKRLSSLGVDNILTQSIIAHGQALSAELNRLIDDELSAKSALGHHYFSSVESFELSARAARIVMGSHVISTLLYTDFTEQFADLSWVAVCLNRLLSSPTDCPVPSELYERAYAVMQALADSDRAFSIVNYHIGVKEQFAAGDLNLGGSHAK